jgi:MarR family transcriptional regulator for hemolysin
MLAGMGRPHTEPVGLQVARAAKEIGRAFDTALAAEGGSVPAWLVLVSLKAGTHRMQRQLAESVGIEGPTLTHHLDRMEQVGLVTRSRDPGNRRVQRVELTAEGEATFHRLRAAVTRFDHHLRRGVSDEEIATTADVLRRLRLNAAAASTANAAGASTGAAVRGGAVLRGPK